MTVCETVIQSETVMRWVSYTKSNKLTGFYFTDAQEIACKRISCSFEQSFWKIHFVFVCKHILTNIVIFSEEWYLQNKGFKQLK